MGDNGLSFKKLVQEVETDKILQKDGVLATKWRELLAESDI